MHFNGIMKYHPPIESRETDELIEMVVVGAPAFQAEAVALADKELTARGLKKEDIEIRYEQIVEKTIEYLKQEELDMAKEDFLLAEKMVMMIFWPFELFHNWSLRSDGYATRANTRIKMIIAGAALWLIAEIVRRIAGLFIGE